MSAATLPFAAILDVVAATVGPPVEGQAGGCIELWAQTPDGRVLTIAPDDGPWRLDISGRVTLSHFEVAAYPNAAHYLDGGDPDSRQSADPTIDALTVTLSTLTAPTADQ
ncbi:hypothetical protein [Cryptosporangium minutisporangium]|uniref:Uncharacterized protein n=1 Tax=Cryptosporangium minutisporangium TaxID=113569 RepID=A0ABP6SVE5_9ACTN